MNLFCIKKRSEASYQIQYVLSWNSQKSNFQKSKTFGSLLFTVVDFSQILYFLVPKGVATKRSSTQREHHKKLHHLM